VHGSSFDQMLSLILLPRHTTTVLDLGEDARVLLNVVTCTVSVPQCVIDSYLSESITATAAVFSALTLLIQHQEEHPACKN